MYSARVYFRSHKRSTQLENSGGCFPYHQVRFSLESRIAQEQDNQDGLTNAGLIKIPLNNFPCTNLIIFEKNNTPAIRRANRILTSCWPRSRRGPKCLYGIVWVLPSSLLIWLSL